jgi:hypothetical protein
MAAHDIFKKLGGGIHFNSRVNPHVQAKHKTDNNKKNNAAELDFFAEDSENKPEQIRSGSKKRKLEQTDEKGQNKRQKIHDDHSSDEDVDDAESSGHEKDDQIAIQNAPQVTIDYDENKAIDPIASFQDLLSLGVDSWLVEAIEQQGWTTPTPIQAHLLPVWLNSEQRVPDILARAPTGSGKTAAYVVPVLHHLHRLLSAESAPKQTKTNKNAATKSAVNNSLPRTEQTASSVRALILAPTRELTQQISHLATQLLQHAPREISVHVLGKSISPEQRPELLISTPQRLLTLIEKRKLDISRYVQHGNQTRADWLTLTTSLSCDL